MRNYHHFRKSCWLVLGLVCHLLIQAAEHPLDVQVTAGIDNVIPPGEGLFPVQVLIRNDQLNTEGIIEVMQTDNGLHDVIYRLPFQSPANSSKQYVMHVRHQPDRRLVVRLTFADRDLPPIRLDEFGNASERPIVITSGLSETYLGRANFAKSYRFREVEPAELPADPLAYDSIHAVMLTGSTIAQLPAETLRALGQVLHTGGRLIILDPIGTPGFSDKLSLLGVDDLNLGRQAIYMVGAGILGSGGSSLSSPFWLDGDEPRPALADPLFPGWKQKEEFFISSLDESLFANLTRRKGTYGMSGFIWLALIVLGYVLVIGPLDWWLCRVTGKVHLTWVIFFSAIILFSVVAYWYSTIVHSGNMQAIRINVLDTAVDQAPARGTGILWFYSTRNHSYTFHPEQPQTVLTCREAQISASGIAPVTIQAELPYDIKARIPIFSSKTFDADWSQRLDQPYQVSEEGELLQVSLPEDQQVIKAWLATSEGLEPLSVNNAPDGLELSKTEELDAWPRLLYDLAASMRQLRPSTRLPEGSALHDFLLWTSFAHVSPDAEEDEPEGNTDPAPDMTDEDMIFSMPTSGFDRSAYIEELIHEMKPREQALNISHRLANGGRVLMLVLRPDDDLLQLELPGNEIEVRALNVVRLQLPPTP